MEREHLQALESSKAWLHMVIKMSPLKSSEQVNFQSKCWTGLDHLKTEDLLPFSPPSLPVMVSTSSTVGGECALTAPCITTWQVHGEAFSFPALQYIVFSLEAG